jgi:hypothetical protein
MINRLPKLKMETKLLRSGNLSLKSLQATFVLFLILYHPFMLWIILTSHALISSMCHIFPIQTLSRRRNASDLIKFIILLWKFIEIFTPFRQIFNLRLLNEVLPYYGSWRMLRLFFKKGNSILVTNYKPFTSLYSFSKIFVCMTHDHHSVSFQSKIHPNQHGLVKYKYRLYQVRQLLKWYSIMFVHRDSMTVFWS